MNDGILLAYARAMRSAQHLEGALKLLFGLHNVISGISKVPKITDEEFEELMLSGDDKTLGQALRGSFKKLSQLGIAPLPDVAQRVLWGAVQARNFLAHHYFERRGVLGNDKNAWPYLIAELNWYSEVFATLLPTVDKWTDMLLKAMGIDVDDLNSAKQFFDARIPDLRRQQLKLLRDELERIGIKVSEVPELPAGYSD